MFGHRRRRSRSRSCPIACAASAACPPVAAAAASSATGATLADAHARDAARALRRRDVDCPVYQREKLDVGLTFTGPAIARSVRLHHRVCARPGGAVDEWKNIIVTREALT